MLIIGITGTIGSGKGTVVDYLVNKKDFVHYSARGLLMEEIEKRGMPVDRQSMNIVSNDLRATHGPSFIAESLYKKAIVNGSNAIIEALRAPGEVHFLRSQPHFSLLAVDADLETRYQRILKRNSETDHVTFEEFKAIDEKEMASNDPTKQNVNACVKLADFCVKNIGSVEELYCQVDEVLEKLSK